MSFCMVSWGIVQLSMGFVPSWGYLTLCRVLLGVMEVGAYFGRHLLHVELDRRVSSLLSCSSFQRGKP